MKYNYEQEYNKVMKESKDILNNARKQYEEMNKRLNTETLEKEAGALIRNTNEELLSIKRAFIEEATQGLSANKADIEERRELVQQAKTTQDKILEQLSRANTVQELESQLVLASDRNEVLQILDSITDPITFRIARAKAFLLLAEQEDKLAVKNAKFRDPQLDEIDNALSQVEYMKRDFLSPILPVGVDSVESFITGKKISDYYFK